jgi:hypothetical protein
MFKLGIGIGAVFAVLMIVIGGLQYMTTDSLQGKDEGRKRIKNAIYGLVLVIGSYTILYTINPNLLTLNLNIDPILIKPVSEGGSLISGGARVPMTVGQIEESNGVRSYLEENGVEAYKGPCTEGQTTGCVNLNGLPKSAQDGLVSIQEDCDCSIIITGGTEAGHASHGVGKAIVDLRTTGDLNAYVSKNKVGSAVQLSYGVQYKVKVGDSTVTFVREDDHWHVIF